MLCDSLFPYPIEGSLFGDTERSFGVRAACCRFLFRKLVCESLAHRSECQRWEIHNNVVGFEIGDFDAGKKA
jgi:hypothetical protein